MKKTINELQNRIMDYAIKRLGPGSTKEFLEFFEINVFDFLAYKGSLVAESSERSKSKEECDCPICKLRKSGKLSDQGVFSGSITEFLQAFKDEGAMGEDGALRVLRPVKMNGHNPTEEAPPKALDSMDEFLVKNVKAITDNITKMQKEMDDIRGMMARDRGPQAKDAVGSGN